MLDYAIIKLRKIMEKLTIKKDLSKTLESYSDEWVALSEDAKKVVGEGKTAKEALREAKEKGEDNPIMTKVPKEYGNYVL